MLSQEVFVQQAGVEGCGGGVEGEGFECHVGADFEGLGTLKGFDGVHVPSEGSVAAHEHGGYAQRVGLCETLDNDAAGCPFVVALDFPGGHGPCDGHAAVEVIGVGRAETGQFACGLGEGDRATGMGVHDRKHAFVAEGAEETAVGRRVGGGFEVARDHLSLEVNKDDIRRLEGIVGDTARFDGEETGGRVEDAHVTEGEVDESGPRQGDIRFAAFFAEGCVLHGGFGCGGLPDAGAIQRPRIP